MSLVLNMVGGGGSLKDTDAILTVTVETGSTVTATKGGVTLTPTMWVQAADSTLDYALFVIQASMFDSQNAWTITVSKNGSTKSKTIIISEAVQYSLSFRKLMLYDHGAVSPVIGSIVAGSNTGIIPTRTANADNYFMKGVATSTSGSGGSSVGNYAVDITDYSTMCIVISSGSFTGGAIMYFGTTQEKTSGIPLGSRWSGTPSPNQIINLDISSISGNYYVGFGGYANPGETWQFNLIQFWLEQ